MQIKGLHRSLYKLYGYARKQEVLDAYREKYQGIVDGWEALKEAGTDVKKIPDLLGYSRSTYYCAKQVLTDLQQGILPPSKARKRANKPRWGESERQRVLQIRRQNPTYGKYKIHQILRRDDNLEISESTVGRILKHLMSKKLITRSVSAVRSRKKRQFNKGHAKPWHYKHYSDMVLGERIQVDHMSVTKNGVRIKHFQAGDRRSKFIHVQLYGNATSRSATKFLLDLMEQCLFLIHSIQVDGGSEFMGEFEAACAELNLELMVLPPASPKKYGGVERGNRIFKEEFYAQPSLADSLGAICLELKRALEKYNTYRPHYGLDGLTPEAYIQRSMNEADSLSQST